jgi:hypothetical protein
MANVLPENEYFSISLPFDGKNYVGSRKGRNLYDL